jgi:acetyl-CoA carboxylase biotin carboxyl carrier protein
MARKPAAPASWSPLEQLRELAEIVVEHGLTEIEVEHGGTRIRVVRERAGSRSPGVPAEAVAAAPAAGAAPSAAPAVAPPSHLVAIEAPMVGTFYRSSSPQAPPYVSEGDLITEGQVLCLIEAMKLMNEIEARMSGRIARILVENAQAVEYGQPLFLIDPTGHSGSAQG